MKQEALISEAKKVLPKLESFSDDLIKEIAAEKAYNIGRRATYKDYVDMYFILKESVADLEEIIGLCQEKFEGKFNKRLFLEQLLYLEDIKEKENIQFLDGGVKREEIQSFFEKKIKQIEA